MRPMVVAAAAFAILLSCTIGSFHAAAAAPDRGAAGPRQSLRLGDGWRFKQDDTLAGVEQPGFQDDGWAVVRVPHTWNRVGYYKDHPLPRTNTLELVNKTQGVGWYRLNFTPPESFKGRRAWLQFDAASRTAEVWLNGVRIGGHAGGFSRFRLDASRALKPGESNQLVVKTDNSKPAPGSSTADVLPLAGDFFVHGGLYRPVSLIATGAVHLDMLDYGSSGVYASTTSIRSGKARVSVRSKVRNDGASAERLTVVTRLIDAQGAVAAEQSSRLSLTAGGGSTVAQSLDIARAHLWQGVADPYLYQLVVEVRGAGGQVLDRVEQAFGVRQMSFHLHDGFRLNGKPLRLHGVGLHQDREGKGWALDEADIAADVAMIREMGANTIRLTHYQHGQTIHDLADRYGLVLWDEIPLVSVWTLSPGQREATPGLVANARQQLTELIRQNYNHASVGVWGIANEVDFGNSLPNFLAAGGDDPPDPIPLLRQLDALAKAEDPTRPTVQADCCQGRTFPPHVKVPDVIGATDLVGANRYFGWYYGSAGDVGQHLDDLRAARPDQRLSVSEYGAGGAATLHTDDPLGGPVDFAGRDQPEEYLSLFHERAWAVLASKPYLWATWLWNSVDFATTVRREGDAEDINTKGLVTYDRQVKKDAFFFYKANWNQAPTVHINSRRYVDRAYRVVEVRVYSNAPKTELTLNGRSLGVLGPCPQMTCVWKGVELAVGRNAVSAIGRFPTRVVEDRIDWSLSSEVARNLRIDSGAVVAASASSGRFGSDAFFEGGRGGTLKKASDFGKPAAPGNIANTKDSAVAATYRQGDFRYRIPLENGRYTVALTFVEPSAAAGERQFDVLADGDEKLSGLDVAAAAGGSAIAVRRSFPVQVTTGFLDLRFVPRRGEAIVSAVEIENAEAQK